MIRAEHDRVWSTAERMATEYRRWRAESAGIHGSEVQYRWYLLAGIYKSFMADPPAFYWPHALPRSAISWVTDVTQAVPSRSGADVAHGIARLRLDIVGIGLARMGLGWLRVQVCRVRWTK